MAQCQFYAYILPAWICLKITIPDISKTIRATEKPNISINSVLKALLNAVIFIPEDRLDKKLPTGPNMYYYREFGFQCSVYLENCGCHRKTEAYFEISAKKPFRKI